MIQLKNKKALTLLRIAALIVTLTSIYIFAPWQFALYYFYPLPANVQAQTQEAIEQGIDGIIVYIHKQGQQPEYFANGWHNRKHKIPAYPSALFKIGSIRKLYDAAALTKLAAIGRIDIDKTLADYLPSLIGRIENADKITLRMMVKHKSGIPNYTDTDNFDWSITYPDPLALVLDKPADFSPDADYGYSNTNYLLLRKIMSNVLGYDHNQYIKDEILTPLGLTHTFSSVHEINLVALNKGTFFDEQEQALYASLYKYEHTGWVLGYSSIARYYKDIDTVVVQFINTNGDDTVMLTEIIYNRIIDIVTAQQ